MSTGRGILRNVCIGSWTLYDFSSQSEHYTANGKEWGCKQGFKIHHIPSCMNEVWRGN